MISVEGLSVEFNATPLFADVSYVINKKDRIALVGKNGAGKSTMLKILAGLQNPTCAGLHHGFARGFRTIAALRGARQSASGDRLRGQRAGRRARGLRQDDCR